MNPEEFRCFSIAWDWMFRGVTEEGICRESVASLECAILNRLNRRQSLAIPELAILQTASLMTPPESDPYLFQRPKEFPIIQRMEDGGAYAPTNNKTILRGILPSLRYVASQEDAAYQKAHAALDREDVSLTIAVRPNSWENPQVHALDPYGSSDFFCRLCSRELSNVYMHCDGCEKLLKMDFNICVYCHDEGAYKANIQMNPHSNKRRSLLNHTGKMTRNEASKCPCKNGPACKDCGFCVGCSCKCHQRFTLYSRFFKKEEVDSLLERVERIAYDDNEKERADGLSKAEAVAHRLTAAVTKPIRVVATSAKASPPADEVQGADSDGGSTKRGTKRSHQTVSASGSGRQSKRVRTSSTVDNEETAGTNGGANSREARRLKRHEHIQVPTPAKKVRRCSKSGIIVSLGK